MTGVEVAGVTISRDVGIIVGGLVLLATYLYVGKAYVGPDDNWWGPLRRTVLPRLDRALHGVGGYATNRARPHELIGSSPRPPEFAPATGDRGVEQYLYDAGYLWNFAAGLKQNPEGVVEYSSWAKRRVANPRLRAAFDRLGGVPIAGVAPEIVESIVARRQVHVTLFRTDGGTELYAHEEPNAINPLMFVAHYRGGKSLLGRKVRFQSADLGVRVAARDLLEAGCPLDLSPRAVELLGENPTDVVERGVEADGGRA